MQIVWNGEAFGGEIKQTLVAKQAVVDVLPKPSARVLVVDDCRDYAQSISLICRFWGHPTECCFDAAAALLAAESFDPQVFLIDVAMPRVGGYELVAELRKNPRFATSLFVGVSGYADEAHRALGLSSGFDHYLVKPVDFKELQGLLGDREVPARVLPLRVRAMPQGELEVTAI